MPDAQRKKNPQVDSVISYQLSVISYQLSAFRSQKSKVKSQKSEFYSLEPLCKRASEPFLPMNHEL
jgi:hypothetical protein